MCEISVISDYTKVVNLSDSDTEIMWKFPSSMEEMSIYTTVTDKIFGKMYLKFYFRQVNSN